MPVRLVVLTSFWFLFVAVAAPTLVITGAIEPWIAYVVASYYVWLLLPLLLFARWVAADSKVHRLSRRWALPVALSWLLVPFVSAVPYFFASRGWKRGLLVSAAFCVFVVVASLLSLWLALQVGSIDPEVFYGV